MSRFTILLSCFLFCLLPASFSKMARAQDMLVLAFEDSIIAQGKRVDCELYYVFMGDNNAMEKGVMLQVIRFANRPNEYGLSRARFCFTKPLSVVQIDWEPQAGERVGSVEKGRILKDGSRATGHIYQILEHSTDASQEGVKNRVRSVRFNSLPRYVKDACLPTMISRLTPEEQLQFHRMQAEQIKANNKITDIYLEALK